MFSFLPRSKHYRKLYIISLLLIIALSYPPVRQVVSPFVASLNPLRPLDQAKKSSYEVFGFAPYWTFHKLANVDFLTLTTFAYFGIAVDGEGNLIRDDQGYRTFESERATNIFKKAHANDTRVVLTITQMDNDDIKSLLSNAAYQQQAIQQVVSLVLKRGIDGINVDFEYVGKPQRRYRDAFTMFVAGLMHEMHKVLPDSRVTVSVYASSVREPKLYDIASLAKVSDGIFMMAYDFAAFGSDTAMPTAPLYGRKEGKYPNDVASSVEEFLSVMSASKLIMGVPYYGYDYLVYEPVVKSETLPSLSWQGQARAATYEYAKKHIVADKEGWDDIGKVGWKAYLDPETDTWRMIFLDDERSLRYKYSFAKHKQLAGVGMWALGFDNGEDTLWALLREEFGTKLAGSIPSQRIIN